MQTRSLNSTFLFYKQLLSATTDLTEEEFLKEVESSGAKVSKSGIILSFGDILSTIIERPNNQILLKDTKVLIRYFVTRNRRMFTNYFINALYPHAYRLIYRFKYRDLCLGDNYDTCDHLLKKFKLTEAKFIIEDILKWTWNEKGHWSINRTTLNTTSRVFEFKQCEKCSAVYFDQCKNAYCEGNS